MVILENIDIDKAILQNIDIDKISNRFKFGISNRATARDECVCRQFLPISIATIELLRHYHRHYRPHHHYLTLPPIKDLKEMN